MKHLVGYVGREKCPPLDPNLSSSLNTFISGTENDGKGNVEYTLIININSPIPSYFSSVTRVLNNIKNRYSRRFNPGLVVHSNGRGKTFTVCRRKGET